MPPPAPQRWPQRNANGAPYRYKLDVKLRFVTEELGFDGDSDAFQFLIDQDAQELLELRDSEYYFLTAKAKGHFESAKTRAFGRVDIKGQI